MESGVCGVGVSLRFCVVLALRVVSLKWSASGSLFGDMYQL